MDSRFIGVIFAALGLPICSQAQQPSPQAPVAGPLASEISSPFAMSLTSGLETYEDSPRSSISRGIGLTVIWDNLRYNQVYQPGENYFRVRATYYYESHSERYDTDRKHHSGDGLFRYQRPILALSDDGMHTVSVIGKYGVHYNSQQLEEFEQLATAAVGMNNRFGTTNYYDLGVALGFAYSVEEKDDDWPRIAQGIPESDLKREGTGYYFELRNSYTFAHSGVQLYIDYQRYEGLWGYRNDKSYTSDTLGFGVVAPLANQNNLLIVEAQYIARDSEQDLLGFDDTIYRIGVEYVHYF